MVVRNDVRSDVAATIDNAQVTAVSGAIRLEATENSTITATVDSTVTASGKCVGTGAVLAVNGTIATNTILSKSNATITNSTVTATAEMLFSARRTAL